MRPNYKHELRDAETKRALLLCKVAQQQHRDFAGATFVKVFTYTALEVEANTREQKGRTNHDHHKAHRAAKSET